MKMYELWKAHAIQIGFPIICKWSPSWDGAAALHEPLALPASDLHQH